MTAALYISRQTGQMPELIPAARDTLEADPHHRNDYPSIEVTPASQNDGTRGAAIRGVEGFALRLPPPHHSAWRPHPPLDIR